MERVAFREAVTFGKDAPAKRVKADNLEMKQRIFCACEKIAKQRENSFYDFRWDFATQSRAIAGDR